jgi:hypothetical protein
MAMDKSFDPYDNAMEPLMSHNWEPPPYHRLEQMPYPQLSNLSQGDARHTDARLDDCERKIAELQAKLEGFEKRLDPIVPNGEMRWMP